MTTPDPMAPVSERLMELLAARVVKDKDGNAKERTPIDDSEYLEMLWRLVRRLEARTIERPENLPQVLALQQRMNEIVNVTIAVNADRYARDPMSGYSMAECARILKVSTPAASQRRATGNKIINVRVEQSGAISFSEAQREKAAIAEAAAYAMDQINPERINVTSLTDYIARHRKAS